MGKQVKDATEEQKRNAQKETFLSMLFSFNENGQREFMKVALSAPTNPPLIIVSPF